MPIFTNPFKKCSANDFKDVYAPLEKVERHPSEKTVSSARATTSSESITDDTLQVGRQSTGVVGAYTIEDLRTEIVLDVTASGQDTEYDRKSKIISIAIQDVGMGAYQKQLFVLCGFGWLADNLWLTGIALTLPSLTLEFGPASSLVRYTTCAAFVGLCLGASFWGIASDIFGRRLAFNVTLFLAGAFGLAIGGASSWIGTCGLYAAVGVGIGGNLPVDGALFLEFLPSASSGWLTLLSIWWPLGQLLASLTAWGLIASYTCDEDLLSCDVSSPGMPCCHKAQNMGWRYFNFTLGALTLLMFTCRLFLFELYESPKFLLSRGRQEEAVAVIHGIAYKNKRKTWLTGEILNDIGGRPAAIAELELTRAEVVKRIFGKFSTERISPLFANRRLGTMTCLIWFCWATIGMGFPLFNAFLPQYLQHAGKDMPPTPTRVVYRNYAITSIIGVPGSVIAYYTVNIKYIGRKYTIAIATFLTGLILFLFTLSPNPNFQLVMTSLEAFFQNIMYGVLYAYTPEVFPAPSRGTGIGIASSLNRIAGLCAPIVGVHAGRVNVNAPIYASAGLMILAFLAMCCFPIETKGRKSF